jgi:hypothetical protein
MFRQSRGKALHTLDALDQICKWGNLTQGNPGWMGRSWSDKGQSALLRPPSLTHFCIAGQISIVDLTSVKQIAKMTRLIAKSGHELLDIMSYFKL